MAEKVVAKKNDKAKAPAKKPKAEPKPVNLADEEKKLQDNYPERKIVKGSIKDAGTYKEFGNKRTVEIKCGTEGCKNVRRVATSDLHQVGHCEDCIKEIRLSRRKTTRPKSEKKKGNPKTPAKKSTQKGKGKPTTKPPAKKTVVSSKAEMDIPPTPAALPHPVD
jgi:hypothetical protein